MKVGDLVRHVNIKNTRLVGIITATKWLHIQCRWKYKVQWAGIHTEEYWFIAMELEVLCN